MRAPSRMRDEWLIGALLELKKLPGGIGHLQDIRFGARGTTKRRVLGGFDAQRIADELVARGIVIKKGKDKYQITDAGYRFLGDADA
jgi:hypothetical protein